MGYAITRAALAAVDVVDELAAFLGRDAPQRNPVRALTVHVTAQNWYPKIWVNFSLFALHYIMAYLFKLLKLNKATHGYLKLGKTNPSQFSKPNTILHLVKPIIIESPNCAGSSKIYFYK